MALLEKILFKNKKVGGTPVSATNLNAVQKNTETALNLLETNIKSETGNTIKVSIDNNYVMKIDLVNANGITISTASVDFPIESMVVNASYLNGIITLTLQNGKTLQVNISDLIKGLVNQSTFDTAVKEINQKISDLILKHTNDITAINKEQEKIKSNLINLESGPAEEIQVNDSSDLEGKIDVRGNTKQETTQGYNLAYDYKGVSNVSGASFKNGIYTTDSITSNNYVQAMRIIYKDEIPIQINETLYISIYFRLKSGTVDKINELKLLSSSISNIAPIQSIIENHTPDKEWHRYIGEYKTKVGSGAISLNVQLYNAKDCVLEFKDIQISKENKPYEPYTGGQASPNPEYPQEIESVKGNVAVKQTGKNLFDKNSIPYKENHRASYNNNVLELIRDDTCDVYKIPISTGTYTIEYNIAYFTPAFVIFDNKGKILYGDTQQNRKTITFTAPKNSAYGLFTFDKTDHEIGQIEKNSQATEYEPYKETLYPLTLGNIELNKIGDSQDYFHKVGSKWYLHNNFDKYELTGAESGWEVGSTFFELKNIGKKPVYCNNYLVYNKDNNLFGSVNGIGKPYTNASIYIVDNRYKGNYNNATLQEYKNWLAKQKTNGTPVYIIYQLEIPIETEITDPVLINQLNNLENAKMFKPTTILTNNSIADMKLDYIADTKTYIDNIIATTNKAIVASEGGN